MRRERQTPDARRRTPDDDDDDDMSGATFAQRWLRPEVYPIFAAIGGAVGLCTFFCTRQLVASPGFTAAKSKRMAGVRETPEDFEEGKKWRNHVVRRTLRSMYLDKGITPQIFGGLNGSYGGGQH